MLPKTLRRWVAAACTAVLGLAGLGAAAGLWGTDGHKIVAQIAYDSLTDKARIEVEKILDGDSIAAVSIWADDVRNTQAYKHTKPWHYADLDESKEEFVLNRDCPDEGCVVQAILDCTETLSRSDATKDQRQEALKFLVHFVGDIHQPLHVGRKGDLGGNSIEVKLYGASYKLHAVWDSGLIKRRGLAWPNYAKALEDKVKPADKAKWLAAMDPSQWATESHKLAEDHAYRTSTGEEISSGDRLDATYYNDNIGIVEEQLTKAGLRLGQLLNNIYDPQPGVGAGPAHDDSVASNVKYVGSRKSQVYHLPGCKDAESIDPHNFVEYSEAPAGKRLHKGCPRQ